MHLIVTRPEVDAVDLKAALERAGHRVTVAPLLTIAFTRAALTFDGVQALAVTSRNGLRALAAGPGLDTARGLPLFVVGDASAALARGLGFERVTAGAGGARELMPHILRLLRPGDGAILCLTGDSVAFDLGPALKSYGFTTVHTVVYRAEAAGGLPAAVVADIGRGDVDGVLLMSARTAETFASLVRAYGLAEPAGRLAYLCLSQAVADGLRDLGPKQARVASRPRTEELLALVSEMASNRP